MSVITLIISRIRTVVPILPFIMLSSFFLWACQGTKFFNKHYFIHGDTSIRIGDHTNDSIVVQYIGCSGFFIRKGDNILLIDPFFSFRSARMRLTTTCNIDNCLRNEIDNIFIRAIGTKNDDKGRIDALLIDHAHLDHFGDVPYLYHSRHLNKNIKIIGNATTGHYARAFYLSCANIVDSVEDFADKKRWIMVNKNIRVLPIKSQHAPHEKILGHGLSFASSRSETSDAKHLLAPCYGTGQTLCYLIDFLNDKGGIDFRIYHNSAGSDPGIGLPPPDILNEHRIDLAILCAASYNQVKCYPEDFICRDTPRYILFSHWEDFLFNSLTEIKQCPRGNYIYRYNKLFRKTDTLLKYLDSANTKIKYSVPNVDAKMTFYY